MKLRTKKCKKIVTYNQKGEKTGWLLELNSDNDDWTEFIKGQVYLTVVSPRAKKGFHLHKLKTNHITCIKGFVTLGVFNGKEIQTYKIGEDNFQTIQITPNLPLAIYNRGDEDAYVVNYCYPSYDSKIKEQEEVEISWKADETR